MKEKIALIEEIKQQIEKFHIYLRRLQNKSKKMSWIRLITFLFFLIIFLTAFFTKYSGLVWIIISSFIISFGIATYFHNKLDFGIKKCRMWIKIKQTQIARAELNWDLIPEDKFSKRDDDFDGADLNITGRFSLHRLIDTTTTKEASVLLKKWLTNSNPEIEKIYYRQSLVKELVPLTRFREKLNLYSHLASGKALSENILINKLKNSDESKQLRRVLLLVSITIIVNLILFILFVLEIIPAYFAFTSLLQTGIYLFNFKFLDENLENAWVIEDEIRKFIGVLSYLENYRYPTASKLKEFCKPLSDPNANPSGLFKQINRIITAISVEKNFVVRFLVNSIFPWDFYFAHKLQTLSNKISEKLPFWFERWNKLEALSSLANFGYLNPGYTFPFISEDESKIVFSAEQIKHPLIHFKKNVGNNLKIENAGQAIIITGSNMSGKSTFLKTVGVNLHLAYAGAPVGADLLSASIFRIFTCIKITDSVTDGISYFYAEVKRLKILLNLLNKKEKRTVFYLIDEIFRGTNNKERLVGSRSYIKELAGKNAIGIISTHDLELVQLADRIKEISNYHFKEEAVKGEMIFDYILREGPCPTTNALKIMKQEGLPVDIIE